MPFFLFWFPVFLSSFVSRAIFLPFFILYFSFLYFVLISMHYIINILVPSSFYHSLFSSTIFKPALSPIFNIKRLSIFLFSILLRYSSSLAPLHLILIPSPFSLPSRRSNSPQPPSPPSPHLPQPQPHHSDPLSYK